MKPKQLLFTLLALLANSNAAAQERTEYVRRSEYDAKIDGIYYRFNYGMTATVSPIASATLHVPAGSVEDYKTTAPWSSFGTIVEIASEIPDDVEIASGSLPADKWSGAAYTVKAITFDSGYGFGEWNESNPNYNQIVGVPAKDANGRNWYDFDYACNWEERKAPLNNWCQNFGDIYARRTFFWDGEMPDNLFLACGHDDAPCEYYLNGQLLFSETDGWFELEMRKLTEAQKALLRPGQLNVLAFHVHQNWGGMYADAGLYTSLSDMGIPNKCGNNLTWTFNAETGTLTVSGTGDMYDYSWSDWEWNPDQRAPWLGIKNAIKRIVVGDGVTSIGAHAFDNCLNLISVSLPGSVTSIRDEAFVNCHSLSNLTLNEGLTHIGSRAFQNTNLKQLVIPNSVETIGGWAFENYNSNPSLESVVLGRSLTEIGEGAFQYQSNLTSIVIPESVTTLGNACFNGCNSLSEVTLNEGLTHIGSHAFKACNLKNVVIPNSVLLIGSYAFENLDNANPSLESVVLGASVTQIGEGAFLNQENLTKVTCLATVPPTISADFTFANYSADLYVPFGSEEAYSSTAPWSSFGTIVAIEEPSPVIAFADANVKALCVANWDTDGDGELSEKEAAAVTSLGYVFHGKTNINSFNELQYFTGLTSIGDQAFDGCSGLTSVTIPNSVTSIGKWAFDLCSGLTSITIPQSVTRIRERTFYGCCGLTSITIPGSVTSIDDCAFGHCSGLTSIIIPESVTSIVGGVFSGCSGLTSIGVEGGNSIYDSRNNCNAIIETSTNRLIAGCMNTIIPNSVTCIGYDAFGGCSGLTSFTIPNSVTSIEEYAFSSCSGLTSFTIPNSVTSIGKYAFASCSGLTSIIIPESVTRIVDGVFCQCSSLTSVTIPESVTRIGDDAFAWCSSLTDVYCYAGVPSTGSFTFYQTYINRATLHVPAASLNAYRTTAPWSSFGTIVAIEEPSPVIDFADANVKELCVAKWDTNGDGELSEAEAAAVISLDQRFCGSDITSFNELQYFTGLMGIDEWAFSDCSSLTSIIIPNSVISIGEYAFHNCSVLSSIIIPNSVKSIGESAFNESGLYSITIPSSVTSINSTIFENCFHLSSIKVESGNPVYDSRDNCNAIIETATNTLIETCCNTFIPNSVTAIGEGAFWSFLFSNLYIPDNVTRIGNQAFGNSEIHHITFGSGVTSIGEYAFSYVSGLIDVYCYAEAVPSTSNNAFVGTYIGAATLYVPAVLLNAYRTTAPWSNFGRIVPFDFVINDETTSFSIEAEVSGKVTFTHNFTGDWEALYLPFAIDYAAIRDDFDLAEIDGVVQNDDDNDGSIDFTVLSIRGFKEQMTTPNTPYLIRAKKAGEQTIIVEDVTIYPTVSGSIDCSSTSTMYEFTGTYNSLNASALANSYVVQGGELVKGASTLAPCRWYMTATPRNGRPLNLPSKIRIMEVEDVITGVETLSGSPLQDENIYNLAGQRLSKPIKGINIINGKKVLRK